MLRPRTLIASAVAVGCLGLTLSGCGVIFGYGGDQPVAVTTTPEGASVEVDGIPIKDGITPTTIYIHPKADHHVSVKMEGFATASRTLTKTIRTDVVIMDAVLTLGIGLLVDYLSGSLYRFEESVRLPMGKVQISRPQPPPVRTNNNGNNGGTKPKVDPNADPCTICGEPRGDASPCPHCGIE